MSTSLDQRELALLTAGPAGPSAGAVAQTTLAADAADVLQWLRMVSTSPDAAVVAAAVDALRRLRTGLRSLRPILDRDWTVHLRADLEPVQEFLSAVLRLDDEVRLLAQPSVDDQRTEVVQRITTPREPLLAMALAAFTAATRQTLVALADGSTPAPLRTAAPIGQAHQPAAHVLPAMLHRRWRKIVRETGPNDLVTLQRRTQEFLVIARLAARGGLHVPKLVTSANRLLTYVTAALRADYADQLRSELPSGRLRKQLTRLAKGGTSASHGITSALAKFAELDDQIVIPADAPAIPAAGGLVVRHSKKGPLVLLVHRIRHNDWSIPKGAANPGEAVEACAVREVREETGLRCRLHRALHHVTYRDRNGRSKQVSYWVMSPVAEVAEPDPNEIDETRWVPLDSAESLVSRKRERAVLQAYQDIPADIPVNIATETVER